jgi:hypothetical protein
LLEPIPGAVPHLHGVFASVDNEKSAKEQSEFVKRSDRFTYYKLMGLAQLGRLGELRAPRSLNQSY